MDHAAVPSPAPASARALPAPGALTFLFTDVEGSTPLWERHEATMRAVAARHDALLDGIIAAHGGTRVRERGEGDSIFAVFAEPARAAAAALDITLAVLAEPWPAEAPIRVRMGLHSGAAQLRAGDYYGPVVNRTARIRGLGHGGQVLLSGATAALVRGSLPDGASLLPLGAHTLRGHAEPEEVFQLCHPALPAEFPPLLSPQAPRHNLPAQLTSLIGREAEQGAVLAALAGARLVTLTGSGGVGKTRLALAVAEELVDQYADGVWLVELAALAEPALVPGALAAALGVREEPGRPLTSTLTDHLKERRTLLVLDNCEHLVGACADLASALLRHCPHLRILATSREGLGIAGERQYRVPSLSVPDPRRLPPPEIAGSYEAVRLFVARARERRADFALTAQNARSVAQICARLDGIPLAIELAAARVPALGVDGVAARLDDRFRLLTGGARDALPRQRTLRAALDWSYDLLSAPEQLLLDRLAVFAGGCTLAAVEAVCAGEGVEQWELLDLLGSLVARSLVQAEEREDGAVRYGLLETVRQYGLERLAAGVRDRHLAHLLALAEEAAPLLQTPEQGAWLARLETEHDNLRAALGWALESGAGEEGLRLAGALSRFWYLRGHLAEGRRWLEQALASGGAPITRAAALRGAGLLAWHQSDFGPAVALFEESLTLSRRVGDRHGTGLTLNNLGGVADTQGDFTRAAALYEESLAVRRAIDDRWGIAAALNNLGSVARKVGEYGRAAALLGESLALWRDLGDRVALATVLNNLGGLAQSQGDFARAKALYGESLAIKRELGDKRGMALALNNIGGVAQEQGDYARATSLHEEALALRRELGDMEGIATSLANLGSVAYMQGDHDRAAALLRDALALVRDVDAREIGTIGLESLFWVIADQGEARRAALLGGAAEAMREALPMPLPPDQHADHERTVGTVRAALGAAAFAAAWAEGRALSLDEAVALALDGAGAPAPGD